MAKNYELIEYMHNSVYLNQYEDNPYSKRKTKIYFSEPESGISEDTGIILLISGYGANTNSNVYKKMRSEFADKYNLVAVQCDYFGWEFMQQSKNIFYPNVDVDALENIFEKEDIDNIYNNNEFDFDKFIEIGSKYNITISTKENLNNESLENFNDMGLLQAIDNIAAVIKVMSIIYDNGHIFNTKKVIIYGQSQGAYLGYLCNRYCPKLFSHIIDNSSWLFPQYLLANRCLIHNIGHLTLNVHFEYLARKLNIDKDILNLQYLYNGFENNCNIISYHGSNDTLIPYEQKEEFCNKIEKCKLIKISEPDLDGKVFKSTSHGLGADFLQLLDCEVNRLTFEKDTMLDLPSEIFIKTREKNYYIDYKEVLPKVIII